MDLFQHLIFTEPWVGTTGDDAVKWFPGFDRTVDRLMSRVMYLSLHNKTDNTQVKIYTVGHKNTPLYFCQYLRQLLTNFQNSVTGTFCGKLAISDY